MPNKPHFTEDGRPKIRYVDVPQSPWAAKGMAYVGEEGGAEAAPTKDGRRSAGTAAKLRRSNRRLRRRLDACRREYNDLLQQLRLAEQVQQAMLPRVLPQLPGVQFGAALRPTQHLAGDFYNVFRIDPYHVGFYLGDVVGHGPAAALLSVFVMQMIRTKRIEGTCYEIIPPARVMEQLNRDVMAADFPHEPFLTMVYGVFDIVRRTWTYSACGHPPTLVVRSDGDVHPLEVNSPLLGVVEGPFVQDEMTLHEGESLLLYSDGGAAARWGEFGDGLPGLTSSLAPRDGRSPQQRIDDSLKLIEFDQHLADDVAILIAQLD